MFGRETCHRKNSCESSMKEIRLTMEEQSLLSCLMCGGFLTIGLFLEHVMSLNPCPLCLVQRFWFLLCGMIAYLSLLHNPNFGIYPLMTIGTGIVGAGYAIWHLLLQFGIAQATSCSPPISFLVSSPNQLIGVLWDSFTGVVGCSNRYWTVPIPAWALASFSLIIFNAASQLRAIIKNA